MTPVPSTPFAHPVVDPARWLDARRALLARERELTHLRDRIAAERRALPWALVDKPYVFDTPDGPRALADLFDGRRQLLVQHFMFAPDWDQGCRSCSFMADHLGGIEVHLRQRDVSLLVVSRAPLDKLQRFRARMGWTFRWVSSFGSDFNADFGVSFDPAARADSSVGYNYTGQPFFDEEAPGISVFLRDDAGAVFHTYSTYGRGVEAMMGTYALLDLLPQGRGERDDAAYKMEWLRLHDSYDASPESTPCCHSKA